MVGGLELKNLTKQFPKGRGGVDGIDLRVEPGERIALVGPSGSGKTTLLRLIAGLETPDKGSVTVNGEVLGNRAPWARELAYAVQGLQPFPHLSVAENLAFGLRARRTTEGLTRQRVEEIAEALRLGPHLNRKPGTLSGGERQRVVLGRCLAMQVALMMLDEPFGGLDPELRVSIREDLVRLHETRGGTWILVTHDQAEALAFGTRVAVLSQGRLQQFDSPRMLYDRPASVTVAQLVGSPPMNLIRARVESEGGAVRVMGLVPGAGWSLPPALPTSRSLASWAGREVMLGFRAESLGLAGPDNPAERPGDVVLVVRLERTQWVGPDQLGDARLASTRLVFRLPAYGGHGPGDRLPVRFPFQAAHWFDPETGQAIPAEGPPIC